jgi:hypothetical protein
MDPYYIINKGIACYFLISLIISYLVFIFLFAIIIIYYLIKMKTFIYATFIIICFTITAPFYFNNINVIGSGLLNNIRLLALSLAIIKDL